MNPEINVYAVGRKAESIKQVPRERLSFPPETATRVLSSSPISLYLRIVVATRFSKKSMKSSEQRALLYCGRRMFACLPHTLHFIRPILPV